MPSGRIIRVNELLKREIADDIHRLFSGTKFDTGSITVTRVETAPDLRDASVSISIFGHEENRIEMIRFLNHHRKDVQARLAQNVKIKYTPRLHFKHDKSLEDGDRVLGILSKLDIPEEENEPEEPQNNE
jgi:ribosome-binding factor A